MGPIICATRGGEASHRTQDRAIALAKERNTELIFLCVVDASFAGPLDERLAVALDDELKRLGRSLLNIAETRAQEQGVSARTVCISGPVWESIEEFFQETNDGTLVIGSSRPSAMDQAFGSGDVAKFAETLRQTVGIEVIIVT
jgi:nucleotide-binding universal stress UspA family protein